jgi:hypothetical protein
MTTPMPLAQHPHTPPDWVKFRRKRGWRTGVRNFFDIVAPIESVANGLLPRIIAEYHIARPAIELRVREGVHGAVLEDIRSGVADLGITFVDELPDTIAMVPLGREVFHAVMPRQHRLAPSRGVTMKQIGREPLVSLPNDSRTRRTIDAAASKQGITDEGAVSRGQPSWLCLGRSSERNCRAQVEINPCIDEWRCPLRWIPPLNVFRPASGSSGCSGCVSDQCVGTVRELIIVTLSGERPGKGST